MQTYSHVAIQMTQITHYVSQLYIIWVVGRDSLTQNQDGAIQLFSTQRLGNNLKTNLTL